MQGYQAADFYEARQAEAMGLIRGYEELNQHTRTRLAEIDEQIAATRLELAQAYMPGLTGEYITRVQELTGFLGFERRDPIRAMEHERKVLNSFIANIEADERYVKRELLAGPDGTLSTKLFELREQAEPWETECSRFESIDGFSWLVGIFYDTPQFDLSWWQADYWKAWAAGDRICKELGVDDFGDDVLPVYLKAAEQRTFWQSEMAIIQGQLDQVHTMVQQRDSSVARRQNLEQIYLEQSQGYLGEYLAEADPGLLEEWLKDKGDGDRAVLMGLRKLAGLVAKRRFLNELLDSGLKEAVQQLRARAGKYARKVQKFLRSKHYFRNVGDRELDQKFAGKVPKYRERQQKLRTLVDRVYAYDDYERFSLANDPSLWWYEFTGKAPPRQLPNTRRWYDRNNQFQLLHDDWSDDAPAVSQAVAAATAARDLDDVGYLS